MPELMWWDVPELMWWDVPELMWRLTDNNATS